VIVVGAGPGGALCARELARAGVDVLLLDRARFPRPKPCAGWITPEVLPMLGWRAESYDGTIQPFRALVVRHRGRTLVTDLGGTASHGILRSEFDHRILLDARASGAAVIEGAPVERVTVRSDGVEVEAAGAVHRALALVGAGGNFCPVARAFGYRKGERIVTAIETETRFEPGILDDDPGTCVQLVPIPDLKGYAWIVRKGEHLNVGLGGYYKDTRARFDRFVADLASAGLVDPAGLASPRGHAYRVYEPGALSGVAGDRHLLIGDAAGFARDYSGEGIRPAMESALDAAATLREALADGGITRDSLSRYADRIRARYGSGPGLAGRAMAAVLSKPVASAFAETVLRVPVLRRRIVCEGIFGLRAAA
jgi:flavin-dependent dehydrogenase